MFKVIKFNLQSLIKYVQFVASPCSEFVIREIENLLLIDTVKVSKFSMKLCKDIYIN